MTEVKAPETAKKTNSELIYTDDSAIFKTKKDMSKAGSRLNDFYLSVISILGDLSEEQIQRLPTEGKRVIKEELTSRFQFKEASESFNLTALGIDPAPAYKKYKPVHWNKYKFHFKDGQFVLQSDDQQPELNKHYYYADSTDKQNAVKLIKDLIKLKDQLIMANLMNGNNDSFLFNLLNGRPIKREDGRLSPIVFNPEGFKDIFKKIDKGRF